MSSAARLEALSLPEFGMPEEMPEVPAAVFRDRLARLRERAAGSGFDLLAVYGDREHSAGLAY